MVDRPIIFSAPMVRALLAGRKTQTRRVWKLPTKGIYELPDMGGWEPTTNGGGACFRISRGGERIPVPETIGIWHRTMGTCLDAPYQPGDQLWVRERAHIDGCVVDYAADCDPARDLKGLGYRPAIFMPRLASRLTLVVTDVRVQRLQKITERDARAEGMKEPSLRDFGGDLAQAAWSDRQVFSRLWNSLHGPDAWDKNPWVIAISFETHRCNIDQMQNEAEVSP